MMRRREFITVVAAKTLWPLAGHAQQSERMRHVGVLINWREGDPFARASAAAFARALAGSGWIEGKNIQIDYRFAGGDPALFKTNAAELVGLVPDVILASTPPAVAALRQQKRTIPIVFVLVVDPVGLGFVQSLARPGGNITGFSAYDAPIMGKWLQLLKEVAPGITRVALMFNPDSAPHAPLFRSALTDAAPSFGMTVTLAPVHDDVEIEGAAAALAREPGGSLVILAEPFVVAHAEVIAAAATRHSLPLISTREILRAGGLLSYWFDPIDVYAQAATYIDRILRGAKPADLPVQQPTKYSLIINLKTAKALGLTVPPAMLDLADEVIE
jgi:putative ABC transport system substrate-binding protein